MSRRSAALLLAAGLVAGCGSGPGKPAVLPLCTTAGTTVTVEQAENAATIAAVGKRMGLPDHAVTIALATALQESGLRNLTYGDRDSLGLFQQRPSQGWGPVATVSTPRLAAASFFRHLQRVPGWQTLEVTTAAQRVQHSAAPEAYAQWENSARQLSVALTGEVAAGLACRYPLPATASGASASHRALDPTPAALLELGPGGLTGAGTPARIWTAAAWLVAHGSSYRLTRVSAGGRTWTAKAGRWAPDPKAKVLAFS